MGKKSITSKLILFVSILQLAGCGRNEGEAKKDSPPAATRMKLNVDMDTEKRYQDAADKGFQPWKKNAADVAEECLINTGTGARKGECKIVSEDASNAVVVVETKDGKFRVSLKRLVKPGGIWTATEIEKEQ